MDACPAGASRRARGETFTHRHLYRSLRMSYKPAGRRSKIRGSELQEQLDALEKRAAGQERHIQARLYNTAADLCLRAGDHSRAKAYSGRAIDAYLEAGYFGAAAAMCRKLIRLEPDVIRARATLAVLYLGKKLVEDSAFEVELVDDYIRAARREGDEKLLTYRLRVMAHATANQELRVLIAQRLLELGDEEAGRRILHTIYREINGLVEPPHLDPAEQWERLLRAALMSPQELTESGLEALEEIA